MPLDAKQMEAASLLALGELTRDEIAERIGMNVRTVYRWLDDEECQAEVTRQARTQGHRPLGAAPRQGHLGLSGASGSGNGPEAR
ncbi:MAG: helix-turn-helix domain-containing protein [Cyanobacteria bacterium REEB65]|nr:helix-turn-helix domain-containing protein [Cyanobacteria bacterium REEB65]